jgi:hypothetical protein
LHRSIQIVFGAPALIRGSFAISPRDDHRLLRIIQQKMTWDSSGHVSSSQIYVSQRYPDGTDAEGFNDVLVVEGHG